MRIGVIKRIEFEGGRFLQANLHLPFLYPAVFRLGKNRSDAPNSPDYLLYLLPPHPKKGEKEVSHQCGALWIKTGEKGENYMSGYVQSPLFIGGRLQLAVFKNKSDGDWLYDVCLIEPKKEGGKQ
ncbi:MAG: DUF736 domain-containing protein [Helicobacteraceae bacterium]|jgi:uncharacterized protein (DUF736 family)|nr:DUF736 domain-containing protein [Helicobacteraceae bacterium]